ncbi:hypothetical protein FQN60_002207 [Etheostoma spectabile]|uniref:Uncharacterized protein n=1 Tax=Etheostoma spectabile TaxID=54343 RepID=A0A5J5DC33_9PERO|nr:hypothetical protein FQN60_002207 [Etheostoma spectabile]
MMKVLSSVLVPQVPEWALDHWHPSEKAMYPDYFAKREQWPSCRPRLNPAAPRPKPSPPPARRETSPLCGGSTSPAPGSAPHKQPSTSRGRSPPQSERKPQQNGVNGSPLSVENHLPSFTCAGVMAEESTRLHPH